MTNLAQKKAQELFDKFYQYANEEFEDKLNEYPGQVLSERRKIRKESSKQCAFIAVDEIMDAIDWHEFEVPNEQLKFWNKVKIEIKKL
jgi:vacuolar-type H+-ATPase subunit H